MQVGEGTVRATAGQALTWASAMGRERLSRALPPGRTLWKPEDAGATVAVHDGHPRRH